MNKHLYKNTHLKDLYHVIVKTNLAEKMLNNFTL